MILFLFKTAIRSFSSAISASAFDEKARFRTRRCCMDIFSLEIIIEKREDTVYKHLALISYENAFDQANSLKFMESSNEKRISEKPRASCNESP
jgi:hypothetical protein